MKVLVLISDRPDPPVNGSRVRNRFLWPELAALGVEVKVLGLSNIPGAGFFPFDRPALPIRFWRSLRKSYHEWPYSTALKNEVSMLQETWKPDIVHAEELRMAKYLPDSKVLKTMTLHNVESELIRKTGSSPYRFFRSIINKLHLCSLLQFEKKSILECDRVYAFSSKDLEKYQALYPDAKWDVTRNGANASGITPVPQVSEKNILFVGSLSYQPNIAGLNWFLDEVLPGLSPDISVTVAGSNAGAEVRNRLAQTRVQFVDTPLSLAPLYEKCTLCIAPLFEGSGTRGKILEALAFERMMITTKLGAEGLELSEGIVYAETAPEFIKAIHQWVANIQDRESAAKGGRAQVLAKYDWRAVAVEMKKMFESVYRI